MLAIRYTLCNRYEWEWIDNSSNEGGSSRDSLEGHVSPSAIARCSFMVIWVKLDFCRLLLLNQNVETTRDAYQS